MYKRLALLSIVFLTLVGCNKKAMSALGIKRGTPDEFTIIPNKPLTIPPMFDLKDPNSNEIILKEVLTEITFMQFSSNTSLHNNNKFSISLSSIEI